MAAGFVRPLNLLLSGFSYLKSSASGEAAVYGMPPSIGIELTNHCNLHCPECATGSGTMKRARGFMDIDLFKRIISEMEPYLYYISLYFQGESLMHPEFPAFIANSRKAVSIISTNGHFLTAENCEKIIRSGLDRLIISMDGLDQNTYSSYRVGGNLETVQEGIRAIVKERKKSGSHMKIEIQLLVNRLNERQIPDLKKLARSLGVQVRLKSMQIINGSNFASWLPEGMKFRRYDEVDGEYRNKNLLPDRCPRLWFNPVVTWDGRVIPCCFDKDAGHIMGDLNQESFTDIWHGARYRLFRKILLTERKTLDICRNCTSGLKGVKY
jgi:radical SAM protein with 4Fe4S-binding SPASM domain